MKDKLQKQNLQLADFDSVFTAKEMTSFGRFQKNEIPPLGKAAEGSQSNWPNHRVYEKENL